MDKGKRIAWLDIAKGIGIILVVAGHIQENEYINFFIYSFHMPLFFILSGYLYKNKEKFIKAKAKSILIPYLSIAIISFLYWCFFERYFREQDVNPIDAFFNIWLAIPSINYVFNTALWFLPCLFTTETMFHLMETKIKNKKILLSILIILSIIGYIYAKFNIIRLPWGLDTAFIAIGFYSFGYWFKRKESIIIQKININLIKKVLIIFACLIITIILPQIAGKMNIGNLVYPIYPVIYITSFAGFFMIYILSNIIKENKILQYLGTNTIIIMGIHEPIKRIALELIIRIFNISLEVIRTNLVGIMLITLIVLVICIPAIYIINNYLPFLIGKKKEKKNVAH